MKKVFLDAGHGGRDPGASGNGLREKDISLSVTLKIGDILKNHGVNVGYSRTTDIFVELQDRAAMANNFGADAFVSIHCNAFNNTTAQGVETFSYPGSANGAKLAKSIQDNIITSKVYTTNRGTKTANFAVLRLTKMPAALVELAFITNPQDADILRNRQDDLALAVAKGILEYFDIPYVRNNKDDKNPPSPFAKEAWEWAKKEGITDGTRPGDACTREEVITMLHRYHKQVAQK